MIYNIDELRKAYNEGKKFKFVFFGDIHRLRTGALIKAASANGGCARSR